MISIRKAATSILAIFLTFLMISIALTYNTFAITSADYDDVKGHWAESFLDRAVSDGILNGSSGKLNPNGTITGAEMAAVLVRALNLQEWEKSYPGTKVGDWYYRYAAIAQKSKILPEDGSLDLNSPISRMQFFESLGNAYKFDESLIDNTLFMSYGDADSFKGESRSTAAFLVTAGIVNGNENHLLQPMKSITRAEFVKILYGIKDAKYVPAPPAEGNATSLSGVKIKLNVSDVEPGGKVEANAEFEGVRESFNCSAIWYYNGVMSEENSTTDKQIKTGVKFSFSNDIAYKRYMPELNNVGLEISCTNDKSGITTKVFTQKTISVKNYLPSYYDEKEGTTVTNEETSQLIVNAEAKNAFVNEKGYASRTRYLLWVNRTTQTVNVFSGSKNNWKIEREMRCSTGSKYTPTPAGVTNVTYKQKNGWTTEDYTVKPVVRFYPNSGYAFHSVLYYPGTTTVMDGTLGKPASHGCVRLAEPDISWIYDNIPVKTAVIIT